MTDMEPISNIISSGKKMRTTNPKRHETVPGMRLDNMRRSLIFFSSSRIKPAGLFKQETEFGPIVIDVVFQQMMGIKRSTHRRGIGKHNAGELLYLLTPDTHQLTRVIIDVGAVGGA